MLHMPIFLRWLLRLGPINPIAVRLVQGGSRRSRHLYIRTIYLGALIVTLLYLLLTMQGGGPLSQLKLAAAASGSFAIVAYLQIALICVLAPVFMAGAIAQEANPRTWDILLTTPMSAGEIVLGNLFGRLFFILALLFSSLPLFALTQYFGGVPGRSIFASYLIAACAALLVGSMAIALSVSRLVGKRAVFAFYVSVISYLAVTYGVDQLVGGGSLVTWMTAINPFLALTALLNPSGYLAYTEGSQTGLASWFLERPVHTWCWLSAGLSAILMVTSTFTVRIGGLAGLGGMSGRGGIPCYRRIFGLGARGANSRPARQVWHNPIAWREAAARNATFARMLARWSFILLGGLWALGLVLYFHGGGIVLPDTYRDVVFYTVIGEVAVISLVAVNMAATSVAREREDGTLDLLLTTPITPASYLGGKMRGMVAYLLPLIAVPVGTLLLAGLYVLVVQVGLITREGGVIYNHSLPGAAAGVMLPIPAILPEAALVVAVVMVPFIAFCVMVGMQWSLKSKGSLSAVVATVGVVGVVGGIVGLCAYKSGTDFQFVGSAIAALSPITAVTATIYPETALAVTVNSHGLASARIGLLIGCAIAAMAYLAVVYGLRANMVHNFDMTVRRLAGVA